MIENKVYEIWVGHYHLGQGYDPPTKPQLMGKVTAPSFKVACYFYSLQNSLNSLKSQIENNRYISDQDLQWYYDIDKMSNPWTGKYYETEEEAWESFPDYYKTNK